MTILLEIDMSKATDNEKKRKYKIKDLSLKVLYL